VQVVSFDNLEDQELEKREVTEGLLLLSLSLIINEHNNSNESCTCAECSRWINLLTVHVGYQHGAS